MGGKTEEVEGEAGTYERRWFLNAVVLCVKQWNSEHQPRCEDGHALVRTVPAVSTSADKRRCKR